MANFIVLELNQPISGSVGDILYLDRKEARVYIVPKAVVERAQIGVGSFSNGHAAPKSIKGLSKAENFRNSVYQAVCGRPGILGGEIAVKLLGPHYQKKYWKVNGALKVLCKAGFISMERNGKGFAYSPKKQLQITHQKSS